MKDLQERISRLSGARRVILETLLKEKATSGTSKENIPHMPDRGSAPLSFAQERLWFLDRLEPGSSAYTMPLALRLTGHLNVPALEQSLTEILRRHEALRTIFAVENDRRVQRILPAMAFTLSQADLSAVAEEQREVKIQGLADAETSRSFDLATGPLMRAALIRLEPEEHILLLTVHHIVFDGWSMGILQRELSVLYEAFSKGDPSPLPELPIQYADFAVWQRQWLQGENLEKLLTFWRERLRGVTALELPTSHPRPAAQTFHGAVHAIQLPRSLTEGLRDLSRREGVTLFMTVLAAFQSLMYRYTGQDDIVVGVPIANRNRQELEGVIGFFVNTLVTRTDTSGNPVFRELLERVRKAAVDAYAHKDLPFEKLVEEINPGRDLSRNPLFQVMFALQNVPVPTMELSGLTMSRMEVQATRTRFDLEVHLREAEEGLRGMFVYSTGLFDAAAVERMAGHYVRILEGIVADPGQRLSELPLLTEAERHRLLVGWNNAKADYPTDKCIHELFEEQVERTPDATAVVFEGRQLTYRELNTKANRLAHHLRQRGVGPGVLVGICMEPSPEMVAGVLGILKAGGAYVPLDPAYPKERIAFMIGDTKVPILLTRQCPADVVPEHSCGVLCVDPGGEGMAQESGEDPVSGATAVDLAYVMYTSGSTGDPKGVMIPHRAVVRLVCNTNYITISSADRMAQISNISFDASTFEIWGALLHGACLVGIPKDMVLVPGDFAARIREQGISVLFVTTALFNQMAREVPTAFRPVRQLLFGGEAVDPTSVRRVVEAGPPGGLLHMYGPTEGTTFTTWYPVEKVPEDAVTIPIGTPVSNTTVYLLDSTLQPVPVGVPGELFIGGDGLALGYLNRAGLTAGQFVPNPFSEEAGARLYRTGDLARLGSGGALEFIGRTDHQIKVRGFRVEPFETEAVLRKHPDIHDAVVVSGKDSTGNNCLIAYTVPKERGLSDGDTLRTFLRSKVPALMIPSLFIAIDRIPLTPNGKIDYQALPEPLPRSERESSQSFQPSKLEQDLIAIWEELLHVHPVGTRDNFFDLGGHSLMIIQVFNRIEKKLGMTVRPSVIFQAPTIEQLAAVISNYRSSDPESLLVPLRANGLRPPLFCLPHITGNALLYHRLAEHLDPDQPVYVLDSSEDVLLSSMEETAARYIREIRGKIPDGPFLLLGFSSGGFMAFEMARQLHRMNLEVPFLGILDTSCLSYCRERIRRWDGAMIRTSLSNLPFWLYYFAPFWLNHYWTAVRNELKKSLAHKTPDPPVEPDDQQEKIIHWLKNYTPGRYPGPLTFYRARAQSLFSPSHDKGWSSFADRVNVQVIPGHHRSIIQEPHVRVLAEKITTALREAVSRFPCQ